MKFNMKEYGELIYIGGGFIFIFLFMYGMLEENGFALGLFLVLGYFVLMWGSSIYFSSSIWQARVLIYVILTLSFKVLFYDMIINPCIQYAADGYIECYNEGTPAFHCEEVRPCIKRRFDHNIISHIREILGWS